MDNLHSSYKSLYTSFRNILVIFFFLLFSLGVHSLQVPEQKYIPISTQNLFMCSQFRVGLSFQKSHKVISLRL